MIFICQSCNARFCYSEDLIKHVKNKHDCDLFLCSKCGKTFKYRKNLNAHVRSAHSNQILECSECDFRSVCKRALQRHIMSYHMQSKRVRKKKKYRKGISYPCDMCSKAFHDRESLKRHFRRQHLNRIIDGDDSQKPIECVICRKTFTRTDNLKRHLRSYHEIDIGNRVVYECATCSREFKHKQNLTSHVRICERKILRSECTKMRQFKCLAPECEAVLTDHCLMDKHYEDKHGVRLIYEDLKFETYGKFREWLVNLQRSTGSQFFVANRWKTSASINRRLICHRSGCGAVKTENRLRFHRLSGSKKLNGYCPAQITVKESHSDKTCIVNTQKTHVGHTVGCVDEFRFLTSDKKIRKAITSKLASEVPLDSILLLHQSTLGSPSKQFGKKDIVNSANPENWASVVGLHFVHFASLSDDAKNVFNFVSKNKENILLFKSESLADEEYGVLNEKDFAIVYMDEFQRELLRKFGNNVIAYDSAHRKNPNDFLLHTILVLDEECGGVPVAFLLSNRNDVTILEIFLDCIKKRVGVLTPTTVMTDMQPFFHNAFEVVMGRAPFFVWSMWYVYEEWKLQLRQIKNEEKERLILMRLYNLSQARNRNVFYSKLTDFLIDRDPDLRHFLKYFGENYAKKTEYWAYCFKVGSNVKASMAVESFHNYFKGQLAKQRKMKNVYRCLCSIQTYLAIEKKYKKVKAVHPQYTAKLKILRNKHHTASKCYLEIEIVPNDGEECPAWLIASFPISKKIKKKRRIKNKNEINNGAGNKVSLISDAESSNVEDCEDDEKTENCEKVNTGGDEKVNATKVDYWDFEPNIVQYHINRPIEDNSLKCCMCKISFEEYSCTCIDYLIKSNICGHIHAIAMYRKGNSHLNASSISDVVITNSNQIVNHDVRHVKENYEIGEDLIPEIEEYEENCIYGEDDASTEVEEYEENYVSGEDYSTPDIKEYEENHGDCEDDLTGNVEDEYEKTFINCKDDSTVDSKMYVENYEDCKDDLTLCCKEEEEKCENGEDEVTGDVQECKENFVECENDTVSNFQQFKEADVEEICKINSMEPLHDVGKIVFVDPLSDFR